MKLAPTMILFLLLPVLPVLPVLSGWACAQEEEAWMEEPWNDAASSAGLSASAMPDILPFNMTGKEPKAFRLASSEVGYHDYISRNRSNELWVRSDITWTQYLQAYQGDGIELVAYTPTGGSADLYRIYYSSGNVSHRGYSLLPGYYHLNISAFELGRTMLIFSVNNQPANAVIIDALPLAAAAASGPVSVESTLPEKARIIIQSSKVKDYDVFVDGAFYSSDISDGASDGVASFTLNGDGMHTITISKRDSPNKTTYKSEHKKEFKGGYTYKLNI